MKISTKGKYGLRAMVDLALFAHENYISLRSIAQRQNISENYLEQLISSLKKASLVNSIRGSQGGYKLSRNPEDISVGQILRALEGSLAPVGCVVEEDPRECEKSDFCVTRVIWEKMRDSINNVVDSISLSDLTDDYIEKSKMTGSMTKKGDYCSG